MREFGRQFLLLGSTGFVGTAIARQLRQRNVEFESVNVRPLLTKQSLISDGGMNSRRLREAVDGKHAVIAVAAGVDGHLMSDEDRWVNEHGRPALAQVCEESGAASITMIGSCFEFGHRQNVKLIQSVATENPSGAYSSSLLVGCRNFLAVEGAVPRKYLRLFQLFGKEERSSRLFPSVCNALREGLGVELKTPHAIRDFCFIDDVAAKVVEIAQSEKHFGKINVCSGVGMSVRHFAELCAEALAVPDEERSKIIKLGSEIHQYPYLVGEPFDDHCQTSPVDLHTLSTALA